MTFLAHLTPASALALLAVVGVIAGAAAGLIRDQLIEHAQDGWGDE